MPRTDTSPSPLSFAAHPAVSRAVHIAIAVLAAGCSTVGPNARSTTTEQATAVGLTAGSLVVVRAQGRFDVRFLIPGTDTMVISRAVDAQPVARGLAPDRMIVGSTIETVRRVRDESGRNVLEVSYEEQTDAAAVTRTRTRVDATSLLPIEQRAELPEGRTVTLIYVAGHVVGIDSAPGQARQYFSTTIADSAYTSGAIDLLLRALPLAAGYRTTIPLYFPADEAVEPLPVRVIGQEQLATRAGRQADCWLIAADFPGGVTEHFWIDEHSHAIVRIIAHDGPTSVVRYDR